jgi:hypothetical protein
MSDFVFNISKGQVAYLATLPAASDALILVLLKTAGLEADATLIDYDNLSLILAAANDEADFTGYTRRTLASVTSGPPDDTNNWMLVDAADPTAYTNSGGAAQAISKAIICYDPDTGAGTDTTMQPLVGLDCVVTFDISVATTLTFNASGFYKAA